jgi:uncharacterized protein (UPF0332 family)
VSLASDLLDQASTLAELDPMKPKQASLRRAISAAYYSLFHLLIDDGARRITTSATLQPYVARSFQHASVKDAANKVIEQSKDSPPWPAPLFTSSIELELIGVCTTLLDLQSLRHSADYNTAVSFKRAEVVAAISRAQAAHQDWASLRSSENATVFLLYSAKLLPAR